MNTNVIMHLKLLLEHIEYYDRMGPFYIYGTEYVEDVRNKIKEMEAEDKINYDEEPVVACRYCKSLHILTDDEMNDHCSRCKSVNELITFNNIHEYNEFVNQKGE